MGVVSYISDRLANIMSGRGTTRDRSTSNAWIMEYLAPDQVEAAYRTNWLVKKIVDVPAKDMTREGRAWQTKGSSIEGLEAEEKRLQLWPKLQRALILARLFGGGALILATGDTDTESELRPDAIKKGGLRFIQVMNRYELNLGDPIMDPESPWFRQPEYFQIATATNGLQNIKLHPSRVVPFIGQAPPEGGRFTQSDSWYWGDPIMLSINEAVQAAMTASAGFAALIDKAQITTIKIPDLMSFFATDEHEQKLINRLTLMHQGESTWRARIADGAEDIQQWQVNWNGMPEILTTYMELVAGAADIPVTRLLGQSPKGLQSTGKGEQADYHDKVEADQGELLAPCLDRIDELLIRSALGTRPSDIYYEFNPLDEPDESQESEIDKRVAETLKIYSDLALFQDEALAEIARNRMVESGRFPGSEAAFEKYKGVPEPDKTVDPNEALTAEEQAAAKAEALRTKGAVTDAQAVALITDARPRTLYVSRKLVNADEVLAWAKGQGFQETLAAGELHVTVCYSRTPVDWLKTGTAWDENDKGQVIVKPGGARVVEALGDKGAIVLMFSSSALSWRHEELVRFGASHDFDDYQPHLTITYKLPDGFDLDAVEPYRGKLAFGPEIFEEVNEDWAPTMKQDDGSKKKTVADYNPDQPRDPAGSSTGGQWTGRTGYRGAPAPETKPQARDFPGVYLAQEREIAEQYGDYVTKYRIKGGKQFLNLSNLKEGSLGRVMVESYAAGRGEPIESEADLKEVAAELHLMPQNNPGWVEHLHRMNLAGTTFGKEAFVINPSSLAAQGKPEKAAAGTASSAKP